MLEAICRELGVEVGKKWLGSDGYYYCISESGQIEVLNKDGELLNYGYAYWEDIFTNKLKPIWKPKRGERYFIPDLTGDSGFRSMVWVGDDWDKQCFEKRLVFETIEEAIEKTEETLKFIKSNYKYK